MSEFERIFLETYDAATAAEEIDVEEAEEDESRYF